MEHEKRIIEAFQSNAISKVLLVDDAYDPPNLDSEMVAGLADFLESEAGRSTCIEHEIEQRTVEAAANAAAEGEMDSEELEAVHRALYMAFVRAGRGFDPGGRFDLLKGPALALLRPLHALLGKCGESIEVRTAGRHDCRERYREFHPQVLFVDYYLGEDVSPAGHVAQHKKTQARKASLEFLNDVVEWVSEDDIPAIVLMSSYNVSNVDRYRHDAGDRQIMSLRFQYLDKNLVRLSDRGFEIAHEAADVLLDTSQGYHFGRYLQQALVQWRMGVELALKGLLDEIRDLHIKDVAYLMRFRLHDEGQPLSEYLEWLFGECLKGLISDKVNWKHESLSKLDSDTSIGANVEGAYDGPTERIAEFFHRVRVDKGASRDREGYQLGDLYAQPKGRDIRAVVTPDCDLVMRKGKAKVSSVLTMGGTLGSFDEEGSVADDFFLRGKTAYCLRWNPKDLATFPISGQGSLHEDDNLGFVGTLRPMYAQEMQRRALTDLSRIGLPVAPALGLNASVAVWIRTTDASDPFKRIGMKSSPLATIIPARTGQRYGHRVLLRRRFFNELIDRLSEFDVSKMDEQDASALKKILGEKGIDKLYGGWLRTGMLTRERGKFGTGFVLGKGANTKQDAPWLQVVLEVSDKAMEELNMIDPLVPNRVDAEG